METLKLKEIGWKLLLIFQYKIGMVDIKYIGI
jgi:hypothetical protein